MTTSNDNPDGTAVRTATFINVGERTNVTGSAKFKKLILDGDYAAAVEVARQQAVEDDETSDAVDDDAAGHGDGRGGQLRGELRAGRQVQLVGCAEKEWTADAKDDDAIRNRIDLQTMLLTFANVLIGDTLDHG